MRASENHAQRSGVSESVLSIGDLQEVLDRRPVSVWLLVLGVAGPEKPLAVSAEGLNVAVAGSKRKTLLQTKRAIDKLVEVGMMSVTADGLVAHGALVGQDEVQLPDGAHLAVSEQLALIRRLSDDKANGTMLTSPDRVEVARPDMRVLLGDVRTAVLDKLIELADPQTGRARVHLEAVADELQVTPKWLAAIVHELHRTYNFATFIRNERDRTEKIITLYVKREGPWTYSVPKYAAWRLQNG